jgi:uncharacterized membrane protein SpoIIM required for sporulation/ABC-type transport system involved in multi-copper enzyme maturation permease subunit
MAKWTIPSLNKRIRQELQPTLLVTRREVRDQVRDWRIIIPILILTLFFPALMNFTADRIVAFVQQYGAPVIAERLIPFLLMIVGFFPISVSLVIALESFVGEKERRSIEPLLSTPLSDVQLYLGKLLASMVPPLLASYLGIAVYLVGVYWQVGWKASPLLLAQILMLTTVQAFVMVSGAVIISTQTTTVRAANLLASFIIVPMALLIQGESVIMFWGRYNALWLAIGGQLVIAVLLVRSGVAYFNREELLGRELDNLNLGWMWRTFKEAFIGDAHSLSGWYRDELPFTLRRMRLPACLMALALLAGVIIGMNQANVFVLPTEVLNWAGVNQGFARGLERLRFFSPTGVGLVWFHNVRAILLATLLGIFTFGVLGVLVLMFPFVIIGYFMTSLARVGISPLSFLTAFILPHGWIEIPAILLAGAAILQLGATLATPSPGRTIGEALLRSLADWARVMLAVVLPLLLLAASLEVLLTPHVVTWILGS